MVNPAQVKAVPGRKTDVKDSAWIAKLLMHRLLSPSFVPNVAQLELRDFTRYRKKRVGEQASERNRIIKLLEASNVRLASVASDPLGKGGRARMNEYPITNAGKDRRGQLQQPYLALDDLLCLRLAGVSETVSETVDETAVGVRACRGERPDLAGRDRSSRTNSQATGIARLQCGPRETSRRRASARRHTRCTEVEQRSRGLSCTNDQDCHPCGCRDAACRGLVRPSLLANTTTGALSAWVPNGPVVACTRTLLAHARSGADPSHSC
jgi:transposase